MSSVPVTVPEPLTFIGVPFPAPGSAPMKASPATIGDRASVPVAVMVTDLEPCAVIVTNAVPGVANGLPPVVTGPPLSTTRVVVDRVPQLPAASLARTEMVWGPLLSDRTVVSGMSM